LEKRKSFLSTLQIICIYYVAAVMISCLIAVLDRENEFMLFTADV